MSDFGRYGSSDYQERERWRDSERNSRRDGDRGDWRSQGGDRWSEQGRRQVGIFSSQNESRFGRQDRDRDSFSGDRQGRGFSRSDRERSDRDRSIFPGGGDDRLIDRDRDRQTYSRSNQPGRLSGGSMTGRDDRFDRDRDWDRNRDNRGREENWRESNRFGNHDDRRHLPIDETDQLIASNKVEGTPVYGREGERLGTIYNFMVDKYSGRVTYAVMAYGGFLGLGQRYYPLPWQILNYDTDEGGYRVDMDAHDIERAPSFSRDQEPRFNRDYGRRVHSWYGLDY